MRSGSRLDSITRIQVLKDLARLHQGVLLTAPDGEVVWVSDALAPTLPADGKRHLAELLDDPEAGAALWERLRRESRLSNHPARLVARDGGHIAATLTAVRLACEGESGPAVVLVRTRGGFGRAADEGREAGLAQRMHDTLRSTLDCAPDAALAVDPSGFIVHANPAFGELLGYSPDLLVDEPFSLYLRHGSDLQRIAEALHSEARVEIPRVEVLARSGETVRVSLYASVLRAPDGSEAGAVAYLRRSSHRDGRRADLERKVSELEHTLRAVAHDLRSPLVALLGFSRLLRDDFSESLGDKGLRFLQRIEQAGRTMESLVQDLLEFSRIGRTQLRKTLVDPGEVLLQLAAELKPRLDQKGTRFEWNAETPLLHCDRTRLYQVLSNLVGNALDHMGSTPEPRIEVEFRREDACDRVTVRDNGQGIPEEHHGRIFEIFQTVRSSSDDRHGTGVGLAIVKKIAETHGGRVWVESEPGAGCTFHVTFPNAEE